MFVVHATARLLAKLGPPPAGEAPASTTSLGAWYATVLRWRSPVALFVNEATLLPVLLPLAPARTLCERFPGVLAAVLAAHTAPTEFIETEIRAMDTCVLAKTVNRSTNGMLTEFSFLADAHRDGAGAAGLTALAVSLAHTPCGPLYKTHVFPDRALQALLATCIDVRAVSRSTSGGSSARTPGKDTAEVHDYHDAETGILASSLAKRAPGYTSLGFPNARRL